MMQGLPVSGSTAQGYQAAPNAMSQFAGLGTSLAGGYGLYNNLTKGTTTPITNPGLGQTTNSAGQAVTDPTYANPSANSGIINQGVLTDPSTAGDYALGVATGGHIKNGSVKRYASGGLVSLAIKNALKG
jgi:hypothetical protein